MLDLTVQLFLKIISKKLAKVEKAHVFSCVWYEV